MTDRDPDGTHKRRWTETWLPVVNTVLRAVSAAAALWRISKGDD